MDPDHSRVPARAGIPSVRPSAASIIVEDIRWHRSVHRPQAVAARAAAAARSGATIVLASDAQVKRLNARHRGRNSPTNVLTFENDGEGGDIILALGTIRREAAAAGKRVAHHLAHLVVHGALHLHGHDHHGVGEARRMEMAETRILRGLGLPNPWRHA